MTRFGDIFGRMLGRLCRNSGPALFIGGAVFAAAVFGAGNIQVERTTPGDNSTAYTPGDDATAFASGGDPFYVFNIYNAGDSDLTGVQLSAAVNAVDPFIDLRWECIRGDNATCSAASGSGDLSSLLVDLPAGGATANNVTVKVWPHFAPYVEADPFRYTLTADNGTLADSATAVTPLLRKVDLRVDKSNGVDGLVAQQALSYTINLYNDGPSDLPDADLAYVDDNLTQAPLGPHPEKCSSEATAPCWELCSVGRDDAGDPISASVDNCPTPLIRGEGDVDQLSFGAAAGGSSQLVIHGALTADAGATISNTASVALFDTATGIEETNTANNSAADANDTISQGTDIQVTTLSPADTVKGVPGEALSYAIKIENVGFVNADEVEVNAAPPLYPSDAAGFLSGEIEWRCEASPGACCNPGTTQCGTSGPVLLEAADALSGKLIDLPAQGAVTLTVTGVIAPQARGTISHTLSVTPPAWVDDLNAANNQDTRDNELQPSADLRIAKSGELLGDKAPYPLRYRIRVDNHGPSSVNAARIEDALGDIALDGDNANWSCSAGGVSCGSGGGAVAASATLDPGEFAEVVVDVSTLDNVSGYITNIASVSDNETGALATATHELVLTGKANLAITKNDGLSAATPGEAHAYTIRVSNDGPDDIYGARIKDTLPDLLQESRWSCSAKTPVPGDLSYLDSYRAGLEQETPAATLASPDGNHVYVAARDSNSLLVYRRETIPSGDFGQLLKLEVEQDGVNDGTDTGGVVDGLQGVTALAISPDGLHLYALGAGEGMISIFQRQTNPAASDFGRLNFLGTVTASDAAGDHLTDASRLLISPDGDHLYAAGAASRRVAVFSRNIGSGQLTFKQSATSGLSESPQGMAISPDGVHLYLAANGQVAMMERTADASASDFGELAAPQLFDDSALAEPLLANSQVLVASDDGNWLYLINGDGATSWISLLKRDPATGEVAYDQAFKETDFGDPAPGAGRMDTLTSLAISADGEHLIAAASNALLVFRRLAASGGLSFEQELVEGVDADGLDGVVDLALTPDGRHLLAAVTDATPVDKVGAVSVFERRAPDPLFDFLELERDGVDASGDDAGVVDGLFGARAAAVSPDGDHVYVASMGDKALSVFERDPGKGLDDESRGAHLSYLEHFTQGEDGVDGLANPVAVLVSPDGKSVYVASRDQDAVAVFTRNHNEASTDYGRLTFLASYRDGVGSVDGLAGASALAMDPAGQHLYVAAQYEAAIGVFARASDGRLRYLTKAVNGGNGVSGLAGVTDLAISRDDGGRHLLAVGAADDSLVVLERQTAVAASDFGHLRFVQMHQAGVGDRPLGVALSRDGRHAYVAAENSHSLALFERNTDPSSAAYGKLSYRTRYVDGADGLDSLRGARSVVVSDDGRRVYVAAGHDDAISVFDRDANGSSLYFGELTQVERRIDGHNGVDGLAGVQDLAISADSRHLYAASLEDSALAAFIRGSGSRCSASGTGNIDERVDIGAGGVLTYTIESRILASATGVLQNKASIDPMGFEDDNAKNNSDDDNTTLAPEADLEITMESGVISAVTGESIRYRIEVTNAGPSNAVGLNGDVVVRALLESQPEIVDGSVEWSCEAEGSGALTFLDVRRNGLEVGQGLQGASAVTSPRDPDGDGRLGSYLYATGVVDNSLAIFEQDPVSGGLSWVTSIIDGANLNGAVVAGLAGARDAAVTADGRFVYVASKVADAVAIFEIGNDGADDIRIDYLGMVEDGIANPGLNQAIALTLSPDDKYLYVAGANDHAISVFARDGSGLLTLVETERQGVNDASDAGASVDGLGGVNDLVVSADGNHLYASGGNVGTVAIFDRDGGTGKLSFRAVLDRAGAGQGLAGAAALALSSDGAQLYVAIAEGNAIAVFNRLDVDSEGYGGLSFHQWLEQGEQAKGLVGVRHLLVSDDGQHLYAAGLEADAVATFKRNPQDGTLAYAGVISDGAGSVDGLDGAAALALSADGRFLYAAGSLDHALVTFARSADTYCPLRGSGDLEAAVNLGAGGVLRFEIKGMIDPAQVLSGDPENPTHLGAGAEVIVADGANLIDPDLLNNQAGDQIALRGEADLGIRKTDHLAEYDGLLGASDLAITAVGDFIYVAGAGENAIGVFRRNTGSVAAAERLSFSSVYRNGEAGVSGLGEVADLLLSDDGGDNLFLYAAGKGDNAIAVFARDAESGGLSVLETQINNALGVTGLSGPAAMALAPSGEQLYVAAEYTSAVVVFDRDLATGRLSYLETLQNGVDSVAGIGGASDLAVSDDGRFLYVLGGEDDAIAVFQRNANNGSALFGRLTFIAVYRNGIDGVVGLDGPAALLIDGERLYTANANGDSLVLFQRDATSGELSFYSAYAEGVNGVAGLAGARDLALSADDGQLYVAGGDAGALTRFAVDPADGTLSYRDKVAEGDSQGALEVAGLDGISRIALIDGELYAAAHLDHALTLLVRDPTSSPVEQQGALIYVADYADGMGGIAPGDQVTYRITLDNQGPSDVVGARVVDHFPDELGEIEWVCNPEGGAECVTSGSEVLDTSVNIPVGGKVHFSATGRVDPRAGGWLINTAEVIAPAAIHDPVSANNSATDDDTVLVPAADLRITKDSGGDTLYSGETFSYQILVENPGPSEAPDSRVTDIPPEALYDSRWQCVAEPNPGLLDPLQILDGELDQVRAVAVDAHRDRLYAAGSLAGSERLVVYDRDSRTGKLSWRQTLAQGVDGMDGLRGVSRLALSADGANLYAAGAGDDTLAVFDLAYLAQGASEPEVALLQVLRDGFGGVNGLGGAAALALSPDDNHLYVAGALDDALAIFERDGSDGALAFVGAIYQGQGSPLVDGLNGVQDLALSPDGDYLYTVAAENHALAIFRRNPVSGGLSFERALLSMTPALGNLDLLNGPAALAMHPSGGWLHVASRGGDGVVLFARDPASGDVDYVASGSFDQGDYPAIEGPAALAYSGDGRQLYVGAREGGAMAVFGIDDPAQPVPFGTHGALDASSQPTDYLALEALAGMDLADDDRFFYSAGPAGLGAFTILAGSRCGLSGEGVIDDLADLSIGGRVTYTLSGKVVRGASGELINSAQVETSAAVVEINPADNIASDRDTFIQRSDIQVSKRHLQAEPAAGGEIEYEITVENLGGGDVSGVTLADNLPIHPAQDPGLVAETIQWSCTGNEHPLQYRWGVADDDFNGMGETLLSPDGRFLYQAGGDAGAVSVWARDANGGVASRVQRVANGDLHGGLSVGGLAGAHALAMSEQGEHLYVAGYADNAVVVFRRDSASGELRYLEQHRSSATIAGLLGPIDLALAPDGNHLYVASREADSIAIFRRDADGGLTYLERERDGFGDMVPESDVMRDARHLAIAPDGEFLYVAGEGSDAIGVFRRDPANGLLAFVAVVRDGATTPSGRVAGLQGVVALLMSPNGEFLYSAGKAADALSVFRRDRDTGQLSFVEGLINGQSGISGLDEPVALAFSSHGAGQLYALGGASNRVVLFARDWSSGRLSGARDYGVLDQSAGGEISIAMTAASDGEDLYLHVGGTGQGMLVDLARVPEAICANGSGSGEPPLFELDLISGARATITIRGNTNADASGDLFNEAVAQLPASGLDPDLSNNRDNDTARLSIVSDLAVTLEGPQGDVAAGSGVEFRLVVENPGPSHAPSAQLAMAVPSHVTGFVWQCVAYGGAACTASASGGIAETLSLPAGSSVEFTIQAEVASDWIGNITWSTQASLNPPGEDPDLGNNGATITTPVVAVADIQVSKVLRQAVVKSGEMVAYGIQVGNAGPGDAASVSISDMMPAALTDVSWRCAGYDGASCAYASGSGDIGVVNALPAGGYLIFSVTGQLSAASTVATLSNIAEANVGNGVTDPDTANNLASVTSEVIREADLAVTASDSADPYAPASQAPFAYRLRIDNAGPSSARGVELENQLPEGASLGGTVNCANPTMLDGRTFRCNVGNLGAGGGVNVTVNLAFPANASGTAVNTATVSAQEQDPLPANNRTQESTWLAQTGLLLEMSLENGVEEVTANSPLRYLLTLANAGDQTIHGSSLGTVRATGLVSGTWQCIPSGDADCTASGGGWLSDNAWRLGPGSKLRYFIDAQAPVSAIVGNNVELMIQAQSNAGSQVAADSDLIGGGIFDDGFE